MANLILQPVSDEIAKRNLESTVWNGLHIDDFRNLVPDKIIQQLLDLHSPSLIQ